MPMPTLKQQWRDLFETEPPPYNRRFLEHRLAHRIQELTYGGLKPETIKRLKAIARDLDGGDPARRRRPAKDRPIAGTRLIREWQGVEYCVTVRDDDYGPGHCGKRSVGWKLGLKGRDGFADGRRCLGD
jgi:Protein of unknown function (DUF2924)